MRIDIRVVPRASRNEALVRHGRLTVRVTAPPVDGAANAAVQQVLAAALDLPSRDVRIVRGEAARNKTVEIVAADETVIRTRLAALGYRP